MADEEKTEEEKKKPEKKAMDRKKAESKKLALKKKKFVKRTKMLKRKTAKARDIGVEVMPPQESCTDDFCPFHGALPVRGQIINGVVVSSKMEDSAVVALAQLYYVKKYERYEKRTKRYLVHNPSCISAAKGDMVKIMECRPLSKNKSFVIIQKGGW